MPINSPLLLTQLTINDFRQQLKQVYPNLTNEWLLLGTEGCHLCEQVKNNLKMVEKIYTIPPIIDIEVMDLDENLLALTAVHIPILVTNKAIANYPFGVMDVVGMI